MGIGKLVNLFTVILFFVPKTVYCASNINHIFGNIYGDAITFDRDTVIYDDVQIILDNINAVRSITINNRGYINSNIDVCSKCRLFIQNSGRMDTTINLGSDARLIQKITNINEVTNIGIANGFDILVCDGADVPFNSVMAIGANATNITFDNVTLRMNKITAVPQISVPNIELRGEILMILESVGYASNGKPIMSNVTGDGILTFYADDIDKIHALQGRVENGNLYIDVIRETDYVKIFPNNIGKFLNNLRNIYPDDPLLSVMDSVPDIDSMYSVMARSVRLHPINLMNPIRTHMAMRDMDIMARGDEFYLAARDMFSSDYYIYGTDISLGTRVLNNWRISGVIGIRRIEYMDDINIFAANVYDGKLEIGYDNEHMIHHANLSAAYARFDVGPVFDGNTMVYNPMGMAGRAMYETGWRFNILSNVEFIPMIGINGDFARVVNESDYKIAGAFGADTIINSGYIVLDYDYILRVRANTNRDIAANFGIRIFSHGDDIGGDISVGVIRDEFATSYNVSGALRVVF